LRPRGKAAGRGGGKSVAERVGLVAVAVAVAIAVGILVEAVAYEGVLDMQSLAEHGQVDGVHIMAMDPDLAHSHVCGPVSVDLGGGGPDMFGEVAQSGGGGTIGLVAEQDGDDDGEEDGEQPMAGGGGAMSLEGAADRMRGGQPWWFSGTGRRGWLAWEGIGTGTGVGRRAWMGEGRGG